MNFFRSPHRYYRERVKRQKSKSFFFHISLIAKIKEEEKAAIIARDKAIKERNYAIKLMEEYKETTKNHTKLILICMSQHQTYMRHFVSSLSSEISTRTNYNYSPSSIVFEEEKKVKKMIDENPIKALIYMIEKMNGIPIERNGLPIRIHGLPIKMHGVTN